MKTQFPHAIKTRFPHTVMLLRSQLDDLSSREIRDWIDRSCNLVATGRGDLLLPNLERLQEDLWLQLDDPR